MHTVSSYSNSEVLSILSIAGEEGCLEQSLQMAFYNRLVFKYLGSWITCNGKSDKDIRTRIWMAKTAFTELKLLLTNTHIGKLERGFKSATFGQCCYKKLRPGQSQEKWKKAASCQNIVYMGNDEVILDREENMKKCWHWQIPVGRY